MGVMQDGYIGGGGVGKRRRDERNLAPVCR